MGEVRETVALDFWSPDGRKLRAWRDMRHGRLGFMQSATTERRDALWVDFIRYVTFDGATWCAKWTGDEFVHCPEGRPADQHRSQVIDFMGWHPSSPAREAWQAHWDDRRKMFIQQRVGGRTERSAPRFASAASGLS